MDWIKIGDKTYHSIVKGVKEGFTILYSSNTGRTETVGARMVLDALGTFFTYTITFVRIDGHEEEYDELFDFTSIPRNDGIFVEFPHNQKTMRYEAYISQGERDLERIDEKSGKVYWGEFSIQAIPMEAQVIPE